MLWMKVSQVIGSGILLAGITLVPFANAEAQVSVRLGRSKAAVSFNPVECSLVMSVLPNATAEAFGRVERSCTAIGSVQAIALRRRVSGSVLAMTQRTASWNFIYHRENGDTGIGSCTGIRPLKFYMSFSRRGPGAISVSAQRAGNLSEAAFRAYLRALLGEGVDLNTVQGQFDLTALGRVRVVGQALPPIAPIGTIHLTVNR